MCVCVFLSFVLYKCNLQVVTLEVHYEEVPQLTLSSDIFFAKETIIQYDSGDHKGIGVAHVKHHLKNQPHFSLMMMKQYWLGKTKPKQAFRSTLNTFMNLLQN